MSELIQKHDNRATIRWKLLTGVSALALTYVTSAAIAGTDDADRPPVWIELGGQVERIGDSTERFSPPFVSLFNPSEISSPVRIQHLPHYSVGGDFKLMFTPDDSNWVFSASLRYGRANRSAKRIQELDLETAKTVITAPIIGLTHYTQVQTAKARKFSHSFYGSKESHTILDFQAGKDVGLGIFRNGESTVSAGVRFAQFQSSSSVAISGDPDFGFSYKYITSFAGYPVFIKQPQQHWHLFAANASMVQSFRGVGPSLEWDSSVPILGNPDSLQVNINWGINGSVLFGKQKAKGHHETRADYAPVVHSTYHDVTALVPVYRHAYPVDRSRSVTVPNIGGFAGISFDYPNAKIKFGYRADFFFGAIDGGIDVRKSGDRSFMGPYASISIGLGD